jgi:hypothetical protein
MAWGGRRFPAEGGDSLRGVVGGRRLQPPASSCERQCPARRRKGGFDRRRAARASVAGCARRPSPAASGVVLRAAMSCGVRRRPGGFDRRRAARASAAGGRRGLRPLEGGEGFGRRPVGRAGGGVGVVRAGGGVVVVRAGGGVVVVREGAMLGRDLVKFFFLSSIAISEAWFRGCCPSPVF